MRLQEKKRKATPMGHKTPFLSNIYQNNYIKTFYETIHE